MLSRDDLLKRLPHREPMLMVDRVLAYDLEASTLVAEKDVRADEPHFKGHFPGAPIMPGVLTVEAMAQAAAVLVNLTQNKTSDEALFYFMSIENCRFRKPVYPGHVLTLQVTKQKRRGDVWVFAGVAKVGDDVVTEAEFIAKSLAKPA
jgi:3-hydroxyacyl-[acyl-carrier-protein] dehydratase